MKNRLISKILGVGVAGSMAIALAGAAFVASPVAADTTKWTKYNTPSWEDGFILPGNNILDYDISGKDGNTIYVVAEVNRACVGDNPFLDDIDTNGLPGSVDNYYGLFKSIDGGVTWKDITQNVIDSKNLPGLDSINYVAVAPDDEDWVAVTGYYSENSPVTVASKDGGDNFSYAGDMKDTGKSSMQTVYDTEVSPELEGIHVIAACGTNNKGEGSVYRLNAGTWLTGSWEDTAYYDGWDGDANGNVGGNTGIYSTAIIDGEFSPNFDIDFTFVIIGVAHKDNTYGSDGYLPFVQTGDFDSKQWGAEASLPDPVQIKNNGDTLVTVPGIWLAGIALPADYDGSDSGSRIVFGYVDALNWTTKKVGGFVFRIDGGDVSPQVSPSGAPLLASIAVNGKADTGKMMIGELIKWDNSKLPNYEAAIVPAEPCAGVRVWHTEELDICCPKWELCCKCPSGTYAARVVYTPDGKKEYATTTSSDADHMFDDVNPAEDFYTVGWGTPSDETAFSVSLDDGRSWNQIGLIDTDISYLSDVTVCPDCSVVYLSTVNGDGEGIDDCGEMGALFSCDSVWRTLDDGDTWERIFHGAWSNTTGQRLELRLPCEDTEDCCDYTDPSAPGGTIYLGVQDTNDMWYSRDCGQCWTKTQNTKITIQDFAVDTESTVYVLSSDGKVSKSTNFGRRWSDAKDTKAGSGHMITVCCAQGLVVVGPKNGDDKVAWSDDDGDSWNQTDKLPGSDDDGVHVACATTCENIIYAAIDSSTEGVGAVYRGDLTDGSWTDMNAMKINYTGIGVGKSDGTLYVLSDEIRADTSKDCDERFKESYTTTYSGVARNLTPCETACCGTEDWDYLICGIDGRDTLADPRDRDYTDFDAQPNGLDLCGCLSASTNTILWAIDRNADQGYYQVSDGKDGSLWTYEDCASKTGPTLVSPADGSVLDCMACAGCGAQPFTLKWNRMCNSCSYDIEIMDDQGNVVITITDEKITGTTPTYYLNSSDGVSAGELTCGSTYQWHVREADTDCECIHSPWSATWTFTVATSSLNGVQLISPKMAANDIGTNNIGFSWTSVPDATSYSLVVSPNANLSGALVSQEISTTAYNYAGPLEHSKTYYWQVKAWKDITLLSTSSVGVFTIAPKPVAPQPPVVVEQTPAPTINIPPAQQITPTWIYAIIGIGAALAVVVIVLIVRTRRP